MKRVISILSCAVVVLAADSKSILAQDLFADPTPAPASSPPAQDPFGAGENTPASTEANAAAEKSLLGGLQPTVAQTDTDFCKCVGASDSKVVQKIEQTLANPTSSQGLEFADAPLEEVITVLEDEYGIPIELDVPALDEIGIGPDEPITISLHSISLRSALRLMLKQLQLTYIIQDEVLVITTPEQAESQLITCVYDVRELIGGQKAAPDFGSLITAIVSCVETETWGVNGGGEAQVRPLKPGFLVISQTQAVHDEVRGLIATLHDALREWPPKAAAESENSATAQSDGDIVVTRSYFLQLPTGSEPNQVLAQIRQLITDSLPDAQWSGKLEDGQPVVLTVLPDRVIVRHSPAVQQELESLLVDGGIANPASQGSGRGFGGGGGRGFGGGQPAGGEGFYQPQPAEND